MTSLLDRLIPPVEDQRIDTRTVDLVAGYVLGVVTLSGLTVFFNRGLTTGIVLLALLLAAMGVFIAIFTSK